MANAPKLTLDQSQLLGRVASHAGRLDVRKLSPRDERMAARLEQLGLVDVSEWSVTLTFKGRAHLAAETAPVKPAPEPAAVAAPAPSNQVNHAPTTTERAATVDGPRIAATTPLNPERGGSPTHRMTTAPPRSGPDAVDTLPRSPSEIIEWREPKRLSQFGGNRRHPWIEAFLEALRGRPGEWACVRTGPIGEIETMGGAARQSSRRHGWGLQIKIRKASDQSAEIFARYEPKATP